MRVFALDVTIIAPAFSPPHSFMLKSLLTLIDREFSEISVSNLVPSSRIVLFKQSIHQISDANDVSAARVAVMPMYRVAGTIYTSTVARPPRPGTIVSAGAKRMEIRAVRTVDISPARRRYNVTVVANEPVRAEPRELRESMKPPETTIVCHYTPSGRLCAIQPTYATPSTRVRTLVSVYGTVIANPPAPFPGWEEFAKMYEMIHGFAESFLSAPKPVAEGGRRRGRRGRGRRY